MPVDNTDADSSGTQTVTYRQAVVGDSNAPGAGFTFDLDNNDGTNIEAVVSGANPRLFRNFDGGTIAANNTAARAWLDEVYEALVTNR